MDIMFNNGHRTLPKDHGHTVMKHEETDAILDVVNDDDQPCTDASASSMNKRKLATAATLVNPEQHHQSNENGKRLCTMNGHQ
jgi:hypothetical protein